MRRVPCPLAVVALLAVGCLVPGLAPLDAPAQSATPPPVVAEYVDPEYGWSVRWDRSWAATPNATVLDLSWAGGAETGGIGVVIQEVPVVQLRADIGTGKPIDALACMAWATAPVPGSPVQQVTDAAGQPVGGGDAALAWCLVWLMADELGVGVPA